MVNSVSIRCPEGSVAIVVTVHSVMAPASRKELEVVIALSKSTRAEHAGALGASTRTNSTRVDIFDT